MANQSKASDRFTNAQRLQIRGSGRGKRTGAQNSKETVHCNAINAMQSHTKTQKLSNTNFKTSKQNGYGYENGKGTLSNNGIDIG